MRNQLVLILLLYTSTVFSQGYTEGYIKDSETGKGIPYVNIGIAGKNIGTVSDIKGWFRLEAEIKYKEDTLIFSMLGYESKEFRIKDYISTHSNPVNIMLKPLIFDLEEVPIYSSRLKIKILGNTTESKGMRAGFSSNELGNEVGIPIKIKKKPVYIQELRVSIAENKYDTLKFRINIYHMKDGMPVKNILKQSIIVHSTLKEGLLKIDLSKFNIIAEEDIFVALEWIEDLGENGLYFSASFSSKGAIARHTSQGTWAKVGPVSIGISIKVLQ